MFFPGRPDPPFDVTFVNHTHNTITLSWKPGFDGGSKQWFRVCIHGNSGQPLTTSTPVTFSNQRHNLRCKKTSMWKLGMQEGTSSWCQNMCDRANILPQGSPMLGPKFRSEPSMQTDAQSPCAVMPPGEIINKGCRWNLAVLISHPNLQLINNYPTQSHLNMQYISSGAPSPWLMLKSL